MNKKGFTLVELLAVIIIIGVVALIGTVSINGVKQKMLKNMFETKLGDVIGIAKTWGGDNKELFTATFSVGGNNRTGTTVTIDALIASGYLRTDDKVAPSDLPSGLTPNSNNYLNGEYLVVKDDLNGTIVNGLQVFVYMEYNRVYACIKKNGNNQGLLSEDAGYTKYGDLDYYC